MSHWARGQQPRRRNQVSSSDMPHSVRQVCPGLFLLRFPSRRPSSGSSLLGSKEGLCSDQLHKQGKPGHNPARRPHLSWGQALRVPSSLAAPFLPVGDVVLTVRGFKDCHGWDTVWDRVRGCAADSWAHSGHNKEPFSSLTRPCGESCPQVVEPACPHSLPCK